MNAKTAKRLRRLARNATIGKPNEAWVAKRQGRGGVVCLTPDCTRGMYRRLTKMVKRAKRASGAARDALRQWQQSSNEKKTRQAA